MKPKAEQTQAFLEACKDFGRGLKSCLLHYKCTQNEAAHRTGVSVSELSRVICGKQRPGPKLMNGLLNLYQSWPYADDATKELSERYLNTFLMELTQFNDDTNNSVIIYNKEKDKDRQRLLDIVGNDD